jgi:4-hydroxy-3-methylbut-2-enyl diphosphate reductase IspH
LQSKNLDRISGDVQLGLKSINAATANLQAFSSRVDSATSRGELQVIVANSQAAAKELLAATTRLREVAEREGARSWLIQRAAEIEWAWFEGVTTVGLTAGASAPEVLVQEVLAAMNERFAVTTENITTAVEEVVFKLPRSLTA